jgi:hypothetical protein
MGVVEAVARVNDELVGELVVLGMRPHRVRHHPSIAKANAQNAFPYVTRGPSPTAVGVGQLEGVADAVR